MILFRSALIGSLFLFLFACSNEENKNNTLKTPEETIVDNSIISDFKYDTLQQAYQGKFGDSFIYLVLNYVSETRAVGFSLFKGIQRNISGNVSWKEGKILCELQEPGDLASDGTFEISINPTDFLLQGNWIPNNNRLSKRTFELKPRKVEPAEDKLNVEKRNNYNYPEVDEYNFTDIFYQANAEDTIDIYFKKEGYCMAELTNTDDQDSRKQTTEVYGNWRFSASQKIEIHWMKNEHINPSKMTFHIQTDVDGYPRLVGNWTLYPYMY